MAKSILSTALSHPAKVRFAPDGAIVKVSKSGASVDVSVLLPGPTNDVEGLAGLAEALAREIGGDLELHLALNSGLTTVLGGATKAMLRFCDPTRVRLACLCGQNDIVDGAIAAGNAIVLIVDQFVDRFHPTDLERSYRDDAAAWDAWHEYLATTSCDCAR